MRLIRRIVVHPAPWRAGEPVERQYYDSGRAIWVSESRAWYNWSDGVDVSNIYSTDPDYVTQRSPE